MLTAMRMLRGWAAALTVAAQVLACGGDSGDAAASASGGMGGGASGIGGGATAAAGGNSPSGVPKLEHVSSTELAVGTHRPEIRTTTDGRVVVAVVEPSGRAGVGQIKHQAYVFDEELEQQGDPFTLTQIDATYGEPADHRAMMVGDELVVVYQSLNYSDDKPMGGPSEDYATDQSLMLARFDLSGTELFREPIVALETDFEQDNFPDHCIAWFDEALLVSTGTRTSDFKIRVADLDAQVSATYQYTASESNVAGTIGNSMFALGGELAMFSSSNPSGSALLTLSAFDADFNATQLASYSDDEDERTFPTDGRMLGDYVLVAFLERARGGEPDFTNNPYGPRLMLLDEQLAVVEEIVVGEDGFAHVHPTMAVLDARIYVAWSRRSGTQAPQVVVERFALSWE